MPRRRRSFRMNKKRRSAWAGTRKVRVGIPRSNAHESRYDVEVRRTRPVSFRVPAGTKTPITLLAKNRRRKATKRRRVVSRRRRAPVRRRRLTAAHKRKISASLRRNARRRPVRRRRVVARAVGKRRAPVRRRRKVTRRRKVARRRTLVRNRRRAPQRRRRVAKRRSPVRRRKTSRRRVSRRRTLVRNRRRAPQRRRKTAKRRSPARSLARRFGKRTAVRRRRSSARKGFLRKNATAMSWIKTGALITTGVVTHKLLTGLLKNILVAKNPTPEADVAVDAEVEGDAPASGLGFLPASMTPYAGIISGAVSAVAGVYLTTRVVKNAETRQMIAGGMVASFLHTVIVDLLKKSNSSFATQIAGVGSDANAARLSAMYGVGGPTSIEPMYSNIGGVGEYFSSGLGDSSYEAAAGTGEYFSSGVGEYFSSGLGEYGSNPDMAQAAAGYGALDAGSNSNHLDPSSNLDRELSIAEAAAGVGSSAMEAAAGLGAISTVGADQTWIPGESDSPIWAGVRPVERSQGQTAMIPAGSLQSGGGQGVFG